MIEIVCKETLYAYDAYHIVKSFFPEAEITQKIKEEQEPLVSVEIEGGSSFCVCRKDGEDVYKRQGLYGSDRNRTDTNGSSEKH